VPIACTEDGISNADVDGNGFDVRRSEDILPKLFN